MKNLIETHSGKSVVLYARLVPAKESAEAPSLSDQCNEMRAYCEAHDFHILNEYVDEGDSEENLKRPALDAMIESVLRQKCKTYAIVVHSYSQISRSLTDLARYVSRFREAGIKLISVTQAVDDCLIGIFFTNSKVLVDQMKSVERSKRIKRIMRENARQGFFNYVQAPFGYKVGDAIAGHAGLVKGKKLVIEEEEATIVKEIFELNGGIGVAAPLGIKAIAEHLNSKFPGCGCGYPWSVQKVRKILSDSVYTGVYMLGARATQRRPTSVSRQSDGVIQSVSIPVPVLVDKELFLKVAAKRTKRFLQKTMTLHGRQERGLSTTEKCANRHISQSAAAVQR